VKKRIEMLKLLEGFLKRKIIFEYKLHEWEFDSRIFFWMFGYD
jgi:hypothetical protein